MTDITDNRIAERVLACNAALQDHLEQLQRNLPVAAELIVTSLLNGGKVMSMGVGSGALAASHFRTLMLNHFEQPRPALPVVLLSCSTELLASNRNVTTPEDLFAQQVNALGHPGDILVSFCDNSSTDILIRANETAQQRQIERIAILPADEHRPEHLTRFDVEMTVSASTGQLVMMQMLVTHCLCDLIDFQLLGI